jgi:tRNA-splicing ligase RtcB (3'-phosphate/5'-hydroxy nucleic acid ligase)
LNLRCALYFDFFVEDPMKKPSLRTSQDVYNQIRWDDRLDPSIFVIGYQTRFDGEREIFLNAFTPGGEIPWYRILYIREADEVQWDRRSKIDKLLNHARERGVDSQRLETEIPEAHNSEPGTLETDNLETGTLEQIALQNPKEEPDMKGKDLLKLGLEPGPAMGVALRLLPKALKRLGTDGVRQALIAVMAKPGAHLEHVYFGDLAKKLHEIANKPVYSPRETPAPYKVYGEGLEKGALEQMHNAASLSVAVRGALMPDAHLGYGLPIGGVLATDNCVIPFAVGVDIACRMKLSVFELPASMLERDSLSLENALERETRFGMGGSFQRPNEHAVLDLDWGVTRLTAGLKDKARAQLGTSGSGNHFVEFGLLELNDPDLGLEAGRYLALMSHSGSRGSGATIANHYSNLAMNLHPELPDTLKRLAWLDLDSEPGQEYWAAMNLMGEYAAANHAVIHKRIAKALGSQVLASIENHHNFAWLERHDGREVVVHRKGATPAGKGVMGVIPGSMAAPAFVVRGRGVPDSLMSASHGAGRAMSRTKAKEQFNWKMIRPQLEAAGVKLLSAGIDENPFAYKDIVQVMAAQRDLVDVVAKFSPRIVKMAQDGEQAED